MEADLRFQLLDELPVTAQATCCLLSAKTLPGASKGREGTARHQPAPGWSSPRKSALTAPPLECTVRVNNLGMDLQRPVIEYVTRANL